MTQAEAVNFMCRNNPEQVGRTLNSLGVTGFATTPTQVENALTNYLLTSNNNIAPFLNIPYNNDAPNETGGAVKKTGEAGKLFEGVNFGQVIGGLLSGVGNVLTGSTGGNAPQLEVKTDQETKETMNTIKYVFIGFFVVVLFLVIFLAFKSKSK